MKTKTEQLKGLPFFIGQGTGIVKEFESKEAMLEFHSSMNIIDRHFCKLYDTISHRLADGWAIMHSSDDKSAWRAWT